MTWFEPEPDQRRRLASLPWFFSWLFVTVVAAVLKPSAHGHGTHQQLGLPPCPSVLIFDRPCPGCGLTTSWTAFVHGDFATSFHAHALGPLLYVMFTASAWAVLYAYLRGERLMTDTPKFNRGVIVGTVIFLTFGLVRMATTQGYAAPNERLMSTALTHRAP